MKKQILKNFISAWFYKFVKLGTSLLLIPIFIDEFGKDGYGIVILISSILSFSVLFEFGIRSGLVRFLAKCQASEDHQNFNEYFNTAIVIYLTIWVVLACVLIATAPFICIQFGIPEKYNEISILLLRTFGVITIFWSFVTPIFSAVTSAFNRYDITNYRQSILGTVSIVTIILAVKYLKIGIVGWAVLTAFFDFVTVCSIIFITFKLAPFLKMSATYYRRSKLSDMLGFGFISFIGWWSRKMKVDADPLILSSIFGPSVIPVYRAGVSMPSHTRPLIAALSGQIHTISTTLYAKGDLKRFNKVFETGTKYTLLMGVPMLVGFLFFSDDILSLWLGTRFTENELAVAAMCMQGMAIIDFCFYLEGSSYAVLYGMNKLKFMTFTDIGLGIINITSSILLVKYSSLGVPAVLLPTIMLEGVARPLYLYYTAGVMGYTKTHILPRIYTPVLIALLVTSLAGWLAEELLPSISLTNLLLKGFLVAVCCVGAMWFIGLNNVDRQEIFYTLKTKY